jgi:signal transduction histidine kinase
MLISLRAVLFLILSVFSISCLATPVSIGPELEQIQIHTVEPLRYLVTPPDIVSPPISELFTVSQRLNLGFFPNRVLWLKFDLQADPKADPNKVYILEIPSRPGNVQLFRGNGDTPVSVSGVLMPIDQRPLKETAVLFPLKLHPGEVNHLTLRMTNRYAHLGFLGLYSEHGWAREKESRNLLFGGYAGLMAALLFISLGLFIFPERKLECLLYMLAQGSIHLAIPANILGYMSLLWPSAVNWDYNIRPLLIATGSLSLGVFSSLFLRLQQRAPAVNYVLLVSAVAVSGSWLWTFWDPMLLSSLTAPLTIWMQIFCLSLGCYFVYHGDRAARFYVVGFGSLLLSSLFTITYTTYQIVNFGSAVPMPISVIQISAVINALALTYAIMERIKEEREMRIRAEIQLRQSAEDSSHLKSDLLRNISHELRTPLNSIVGFSEVLTETLDTGEAHDYAEIINQNSTRLTSIINEILDYTNLEGGGLPLKNSQFNLKELIEEILNYYQPTSTEKHLAVLFEMPFDVPPTVNADRFRVKQILMHVIGNAFEFTKSGTIEITATLNPQNSEQMRIEVKDTGIGIQEDVQRKLFEPFVQGDASPTRTHSGVGMGLKFSRTLARRMGGNVNLVRSAPELGTTVEILIPVSIREPSLPKRESFRQRKPVRYFRFAGFRLRSF